MIEDVEQSLRLQEVDRQIADLNAEVARLPKHIAEIEKQLETHNRKLEADRAAVLANQKERKQRDLDIGTNQQKISKLRDQMRAGKAKSGSSPEKAKGAWLPAIPSAAATCSPIVAAVGGASRRPR